MNIEREAYISPKEKESKNPSLFMVVKPDGGRYLSEIEQTLNEKQVYISDAYFIENWEKVARSMYQKDLENSPRSFRVGFESHIWLTEYLFGNHAILLLVKTVNSDLVTQVHTIDDAKDNFRSKFSASFNTFAIAVNLDKFNDEAFRGSGKRKGHLGISQPNSFNPLIEKDSKGRWFGNYFKYIHSPDSVEQLIFQYNAIDKEEIIKEENKIDKKEWEMLKLIHCLTPPSKIKSF